MAEDTGADHPAWPERTLLLGAGGALFGFLFDRLAGGAEPWMWTDSPGEMAAATFLAVSGIVFALSLERLRWTWSAAFAAGAGVVAALVGWWNGPPQGWGADEGWHFFAGIAAVAIAVPLFQAARDAGRLRFEARAVHVHLWSNAILWAAACAFVGASFLLTLLLSELFHLIGLDFLRDLMGKSWFRWTLACGALGAAIGLLRDRDQVLGVLQRVVRAILSVLAPVLALGLLVFVLALPFTGLEPLWSQTKSTTPILLFCVLAGVVLTNATIGNAADEEARSPLLRYAAMALIAVLLPLAIVAAISTGKRIDQYGFTPDRLWACVFILAAAAFAVSYLLTLLRGRAHWPERLRRANVGLAIALSLLALFLAAPILSFGAISARDQLARLESGETPPEKFDWAAMRFDFGPAGRKALERLVAAGPEPLRARASLALKAQHRSALMAEVAPAPRIDPSVYRIRPEPGGTPVPDSLRRAAGRTGQCTVEECRLFFDTAQRAILVSLPCDRCPPNVVVLVARPGGDWVEARTQQAVGPPPEPASSTAQQRNAFPSGRLEVRSVEKRQLFLNGQPIGPVFAP